MNKIINFIKKNYLKSIGIILFVFIILNIDLTKTFEIIKNINVNFIIFIILLSLTKTILKSTRLCYTLNVFKINYSLKNSIMITYISNFLGSIIPANLSDVFKVIYIKNDLNISSFQFLPGIFFNILLDFTILFTISIIGIFFLNFNINICIILIILLTLILLILFVVNENVFKKVFYSFSKLYSKVIKVNLYKKYYKNISIFFSSLNQLKNYKIIIIIFSTFFIYAIHSTQAFLIGKSLNFNISFLNYVLIISLLNIVSLLPVSISGLGTSQIASVYIFNNYSITRENAIVYSLLVLFLINTIPRIIGFIFWNVRQMRMHKKK